MVTILTPTYNREYTLKDTYNSLLNQTNKSFEWIIVDDGSTDNTRMLVKNIKKENKLDIKYIYKENGGKHTALNLGIEKASGKYILILDSDDTLLPDCVDLVEKKWNNYEDNSKIACLSFLKVFPNNEIIGKKYSEEETISNHIDFRYNRSLLGDMCEIFKTEVLKKYPFPVFNNERFLSETLIWNKIALDYNTVYINKPIYVASYLNDGLSKNYLKLVYNNPIGASENSNMFLIKRFKLKIRIKNAILYDGYCINAKKKLSEIIKNSNSKPLAIIFLPGGVLFYILLKIKFNKKRV